MPPMSILYVGAVQLDQCSEDVREFGLTIANYINSKLTGEPRG